MGLCKFGDKGNMTLDRRQMMGLSAAGVAGVMVPSLPALAQSNAGTSGKFLDHFSAGGFKTLEPLNLITGDAFNGGFRYDDTRASYPATSTACIQPACRVEDAANAGTPGVLALFNIMVLNVPKPSRPGEVLRQIVEYLVVDQNLDPEKLVFVSTEVFEQHLNQSDILQKGRFLKREIDVARAAGDGSGYFAPMGHPLSPSYATVSIHFPLDAGTSADLTYPLPGHLEIAEISLGEPGAAGVNSEIGGIGLERLALAQGKQAPTFNESRTALLETLRQEVARTGGDLPPGYSVFADL
jgi:hypothetical protein